MRGEVCVVEGTVYHAVHSSVFFKWCLTLFLRWGIYASPVLNQQMVVYTSQKSFFCIFSGLIVIPASSVRSHYGPVFKGSLRGSTRWSCILTNLHQGTASSSFSVMHTNPMDSEQRSSPTRRIIPQLCVIYFSLQRSTSSSDFYFVFKVYRRQQLIQLFKFLAGLQVPI